MTKCKDVILWIFLIPLFTILIGYVYASGPYDVAVLLVKDSQTNRFDVERIMPAIVLAKDKCQERYNVQLNLLEGFYMHKCSESDAIGKATTLGKNNDLTAIVGPACSKDLQSVGPYARYLNIPILTGLGDVLRDRKAYTTLIRVSYDLRDKARAMVNFLLHEDWHYFGMVYRNEDVFYSTLAEEIRTIVYKEKIGEIDISCEQSFERAENKTVLSDLRVIMNVMKYCSRIIVILGGEKEVREMLLIAQELDMIDSGEYVFLYPELYQNEARGNESWAGGPEPPEVKEQLKKASQSLFIISLHQPLVGDFVTFAENVKKISVEVYNYTYNQSVNYFTASFHDAVEMLCFAINRTEKEGRDPRNGTALIEYLKNSSFQGVSGPVNINQNGDRVANYAILDQVDAESGDFQVVLTYYGSQGRYTQDSNQFIRWHGRSPDKPVDRPRCGFDGKDPVCAKDEFPLLETIFGALVVVILLALLVGFLIYRRMSSESSLSNMSWKVRWEEITFNKNFRTSWMMSRMSISSAMSSKMEKGWVQWTPDSADPRDSSAQDPNGRHAEQQQLQYIMTGTYKGSLVAVKRLHKQKRVELTRTVLMELKLMREAQHENISRLIGVCIDPPNVAVLTDYCPKGSLYDVIHNDTLNLDWMFRYSLINDIVKGMCYLHSGEIGTHGRLRSTNCLVDSHFVLKLADFGLPSLRQEEVFCEIDFADHKKFLWKAPELLRLTTCPSQGTQKGDIYSFGICLQEIVLREEPFYPHLEFLDVSDVIRRVRKREDPPFRPVVEKDTCIRELRNLMHKCWAEEPSYRPDFNQIKSEMRTINRGQKGEVNIMDNLISRMEQYANNLEQLVELRTAAFLEEKRKSEELLYQVLPKSVAEQLKRGKHVVPELYDSVTIYFSDLVGFTSMCSTSTPIQVVDFLNSLYTCFDSIVSGFDVYKVETIGDAYMVVSGLPDRNGLAHAREIGRLALTLLRAVGSMSIQHRPTEKIKLRIGIHTGPCCAGVVGQKMPRYCLFGDSVNVASRMESTGEPLKIHVSDSAKRALDEFGTFVLEPRGEVEVKGKGRMNTFWLVHEHVNAPAPRQGTTRGRVRAQK